LHPVERLRAVARWSGDNGALAVEAASALAEFAETEDSPGLLVACRRVVSHHRACGPLWWACARVLSAPDPVAAAREAATLLDADSTPDRLAASLPLVGPDGVVAVVGWPDAVDAALASRADVPAVAIRVEGADPFPALRNRSAARSIRVLDAADLEILTVEKLLVGAAALGEGRAIVPRGTEEAIEATGSRPEVWLIGGVGRVLPAALIDAVSAAVEADTATERRIETLPLDRFDRVAGPRGLAATHDAAARIDCPTPPEMLRPL